jgi:hypothetical protein
MPRRSSPASTRPQFRPSPAARCLYEQKLVGGPLPPLYRIKRARRQRSRSQVRQWRAALVDFVAAFTIFVTGSYVTTVVGTRTVQVIATVVTTPSPQTLSAVMALRQAIIGQEVGGQASLSSHTTVNWDGSGALGLAQVMPENLPDWSRECLGRTLSSEEFLADHGLQVQLIDCKLLQFWNEERVTSLGDEALTVRRVASRWYSGQGDWYDSTDPQSWNGTAYPNIQAYTSAVLDRYRAVQAAQTPTTSARKEDG